MAEPLTPKEADYVWLDGNSYIHIGDSVLSAADFILRVIATAKALAASEQMRIHWMQRDQAAKRLADAVDSDEREAVRVVAPWGSRSHSALEAYRKLMPDLDDS